MSQYFKVNTDFKLLEMESLLSVSVSYVARALFHLHVHAGEKLLIWYITTIPLCTARVVYNVRLSIMASYFGSTLL